MDETRQGKISRRSHDSSGHRRSFGPYNRNREPGYYRFGTLRTDKARIASEIIAAKSLRAGAHDELRQCVGASVPTSRAEPGGDLGRCWLRFGSLLTKEECLLLAQSGLLRPPVSIFAFDLGQSAFEFVGPKYPKHNVRLTARSLLLGE